mgnify:CR=1 FL=1
MKVKKEKTKIDIRILFLDLLNEPNLSRINEQSKYCRKIIEGLRKMQEKVRVNERERERMKERDYERRR